MSSVQTRPPAGDEAEEPVPQFPQANCIAVQAMADVLASTLGPRSSDKLVVNRLATRDQPENKGVPATDDYTVANDGATLLNALPMEHPVAPIVTRILGPERPGDTSIEGQDIPDGVSGGVVLTAALLSNAEELLELGLHSYDIRHGYALAMDRALAALAAESRSLSSFEDADWAAAAVARTAMTGNDIGGLADSWAALAVEAVDRIGRPTEETFTVRCLGSGSLADSRLVRGAVLDRNTRANDEMPRRVEDATVLLLDGHTTGGLQDPEWDEDATLKLDSLDKLDAVRDHQAATRRALVDHYVSLGVDVVVTRLGINQAYQRLLADADILAVRGVSPLEMKQCARATGAALVRHPGDVSAADLGFAGSVSEVRIDPRRGRRKNRYMIVIDDCPEATGVSAVVHGVSGQPATQAATEVRKAAAALAAARGEGASRSGVVPGGGAIELTMAAAVRESARAVDGRAQLAVEAFADALERVVGTLVYNGGYDRLSMLADLRAARAGGETALGFVYPAGEITDATAAGVLDPTAYKHRLLVSATEVADLILRVDDAIDATFTKEPLGPGDSIYDDRAEKHLDHLEENPGTRWDT
ncbi:MULTISPECIES: TCP-1/cpn60 chaperonin family protein [unclassified Haladaptatus]|uniref:TCP-1/cpn60 chaperonin family protein n=2 Tax=Haladaptatus TaxID=367188 RepID=UPI0023E80C8C|nr:MULTISPECIES: TCP-1/cpn60 chaperonin family protein [unclassified Haladaptatus]